MHRFIRSPSLISRHTAIRYFDPDSCMKHATCAPRTTERGIGALQPLPQQIRHRIPSGPFRISDGGGSVFAWVYRFSIGREVWAHA